MKLRDVINESLFPGDLNNMVRTTFDIDAFESKIDEDAVTISFYVRDEDAAYDLSRFIEFGPVDVLGTEVSGAPDEDGHYIVYVELDKPRLATDTFNILKTLGYLTSEKQWRYAYRGKVGVINLK